MVVSKNMAKPSRSDPARAFPFPEGIMPRKPRHPCGYPGCPELTERQYCPAHEKVVSSQYNRYGRTPEMKCRYNGAWPRVRRAFLAAHPLCEMCLREGRTTAAEHVHHIIPLSDGGTNDDANLQSLCKRHHSSVHMQERIQKKYGGAPE